MVFQGFIVRWLIFYLTLCLIPLFVLSTKPQSRRYTGRFLHITDIHFDPTYQTNTSVAQFCHRYSETGESAQPYGTLGSPCDAPIALVESTFEYLKQSHLGVDFILYTGDSVRHDRDPQRKRTPQDVLYDHYRVVEYFRNIFDLAKVRVVPTFGNVDPFVYDNMKEGPSQELHALIALWRTLGLELGDDFLKGGYYTVSIIPGKLDIISLNTNYFYQKNQAVAGCEDDSNSPGLQELIWLRKILEAAKMNETKVYIIGHASPHNVQGERAYYESCHQKLAYLIGKYSDVILASLFGHTNVDSVSYVYSTTNGYEINNLSDHIPSTLPDPENIVGILYTAPSIIPFRNPAIRELSYVINSDQGQSIGQISDYIQYIADLDLANSEGQLIYEVEYIASTTYNVPNLSIESWRSILNNLARPGSPTWQAYQRYREVSPRQKSRLIVQSMR